MTKLLQTYLQDHEAGARAGLDLIARAADSHSDPEAQTVLSDLLGQVEEERDQIRTFMDAVDATPSLLKQAGTRIGEKAGRLKPNNRLTDRSPLSDLWELEAILLALRGKELGFASLLAMLSAAQDPRIDRAEVERLRDQARRQQEEIGRLHDRAAAVALTQD